LVLMTLLACPACGPADAGPRAALAESFREFSVACHK